MLGLLFGHFFIFLWLKYNKLALMNEQDYEQPVEDNGKPVENEQQTAVEEQQPKPEQEQPAAPPAVKKKRGTMAKVLMALVVVVVAYLIYSVADVFISPDKNIRQIYLVPKDAVFIIQSADPVNDFTKFSRSETWQTLKKAEPIREIAAQAEMADSIIRSNETLLSLIGRRDLLISVHKTRAADFDFLVILDLQKTAKLNVAKDQIENVFKLLGATVTRRKHNGTDILEVKDPDTREMMYASFVDNHVVFSFTSKLVEQAIDGRHTPEIGLNYSFLEADKLVAGKGLYRMFINYAYLPQFSRIFLGEENESLNMFSSSMEFAGLYFDTNKDKIELKGYTLPREKQDPYVEALFKSGKRKMQAHKIMSARTAVYTNVGIDNPSAFVTELETAMQQNDKALYDTYSSSRKKIESLFGISLQENFLSWMNGEFAMAQLEPGLLGREPELVLAVGTKSIKDARKNMEIIEKKIKNRTPIKIKSVEYKDYEIHYIEMKGFFRLFFGKMFDKFEKPYYTYLDDYVLFSNKPAGLLSFIEDYEQKNLLNNDKGFKKTMDAFDKSSTFFLFADVHKFYPQLKPMLTPATWADINKSKDIVYSFPYCTMQVTGESNHASLHYVMDYKLYDPSESSKLQEAEEKEEDEKDDDDDQEESKQQQLNDLKRFYVEKFQGNVLREFYPEGALKSETEIKDGKRHGRHREYHENGKLMMRGKYSKGQPKGTWRFYTEDGELAGKEKYK